MCCKNCDFTVAVAGRVTNKLIFYARMVTFASFCKNRGRGWMGEMEVEGGQEIAHHHRDGAYAIGMSSLLLLIEEINRVMDLAEDSRQVL